MTGAPNSFDDPERPRRMFSLIFKLREVRITVSLQDGFQDLRDE